MSRLVFEQKWQIWWLEDQPADPAAPTEAEIDAGTELTEWVPKDGVKIGVSNDRVDGGSIATVFKAESMGTYGAQPSLTFFLDDEEAQNVPWGLFNTRLAEGCLVILPFIGKDVTVATGQQAYVFPDLESGVPAINDPATNERQKFMVDFAMTNRDPEWGAVVAAS